MSKAFFDSLKQFLKWLWAFPGRFFKWFLTGGAKFLKWLSTAIGSFFAAIFRGIGSAANLRNLFSNRTPIEDRRPDPDLVLLLGSLFDLGVVACYSCQFLVHGDWSMTLKVAAIGAMVGAAAVGVGSLVGLLFGVPKRVSSPAVAAGTEGASGLQDNTNLSEISDWLTKIFVGLGLTQVTKIPDFVGDLGAFLAPGFGGPSTEASAFAIALVLHSTLVGFFFGYPWAIVIFRSYLDHRSRGRPFSDERAE